MDTRWTRDKEFSRPENNFRVKELDGVDTLTMEMAQEAFTTAKLNPVELHDLTFTHRVYLTGLLRASLDEEAGFIQSLFLSNEHLAPTTTMATSIITALYKTRAIVPDLHTPVWLPPDVHPSKCLIYAPFTEWNLNICQYNSQASIRELLDPPHHTLFNTDEALAMWREIAREEVIEYLEFRIESVGFEFSPGKKSRLIVDNLLTRFSAAQLFTLVYRTVKDAAHSYSDKNCRLSKKHLTNSIVGNLQRRADWITNNGYTVGEFNRPPQCRQSALSKVVYDHVLRIGRDAFYTVPSIDGISGIEEQEVN